MLSSITILLQQNRFAEAEKACKEILATEPQNTDAMHLLALVFYNVGQLEPAKNILRYAVALKPQLDYLSNLGLILSHLGENQEALSCYKQALYLDSNSAPLHNNIGLLYFKMEDWDNALIHFTRAVEIRPDYNISIIHQGHVYMRLGECRKATERYERSLELDPNNFRVHSACLMSKLYY